MVCGCPCLPHRCWHLVGALQLLTTSTNRPIAQAASTARTFAPSLFAQLCQPSCSARHPRSSSASLYRTSSVVRQSPPHSARAARPGNSQTDLFSTCTRVLGRRFSRSSALRSCPTRYSRRAFGPLRAPSIASGIGNDCVLHGYVYRSVPGPQQHHHSLRLRARFVRGRGASHGAP